MVHIIFGVSVFTSILLVFRLMIAVICMSKEINMGRKERNIILIIVSVIVSILWGIYHWLSH